MFFYHFRILGHVSANISTFCGNRQNSIPSVGMHFDENFFKKKCFFVTLGHRAKIFSFFLSKNFWQGCQISFYMSRGPFWGIIYFSGKSRFFSIIFECWVIFFWRVRHNCMLRVRILLEGKQFFSKFFLPLSENERDFFRRSEKKTSAGCQEGNLHVSEMMTSG